MSLILKNALMEKILGIKLNRMEQLEDLDFADDIELTSETEEHLQEKTNLIQKTSESVGLKINVKKTKLMIINDETFNSKPKIIINDEEIEEENEFMYLGSQITNDGDVKAELNNRISKAAYAIHRLNKIWKDKNISLKTKMKLYRSNVVSSLTYGCETWQLTTSQERV